jgi:hypothetical protein
MITNTQRLMAITLSLVLVASIATPAAFAQAKDPSLTSSDIALPTLVPVHTEVGDAPQHPPTAQFVDGTFLDLSSIGGTLEGNNAVDSYEICIDSPSTFTATTQDMANWDTQLTLVDSAGTIIQHNDDSFNQNLGFFTLQSTLNNFVGSPGSYIISISSFSNDPLPNSSPGTTITGWENANGFSSGAYGISFTGADSCMPVGGEFLPIDTTALVIAGASANAIWILPILAGLAGAGLYLTRSKLNWI